MAVKRNRKGRKGPVTSKKVQYDGVTFQSGLERYTYIKLKENKLFEYYEGEVFTLIEGFTPSYQQWEHQGNGKGDFINRQKDIRGITYTPDFTAKDYIIECKGRPNAAFPNRWKLFKKWKTDMGDSRHCYMPKNQKDVDKMIEIIKENRKSKVLHNTVRGKLKKKLDW